MMHFASERGQRLGLAVDQAAAVIQIKEALPIAAHLYAMQTSFVIERLTNEQASQAFPLVHASNPGIELPGWRDFVRFHNSQLPLDHSGVFAMRDRASCICGVFAYRLEQDLINGPIFSIQLFLAADILNSLSTVRALLDAAEVSASKLACTVVQVRLSKNQAMIGSQLETLGLATDGYFAARMVQTAGLN
jgi:hypothetical protein